MAQPELRQRDVEPRRLWTPAGPEAVSGMPQDAPPALLYRRVEGISVDHLNTATHDAKGRSMNRVLDTFIMTLMYASKLEEARNYAPAEPLPVEEILQKLGELPLNRDPLTARVVDVASHDGRDVAVYLDHPVLFEEQRDVTLAVRDMLNLPAPRNIGPLERYVTVIEGQLPRHSQARQLANIRETLPEEITLSALQGLPD
jgi:hypothetical protein